MNMNLISSQQQISNEQYGALLICTIFNSLDLLLLHHIYIEKNVILHISLSFERESI